MEAFEFNSEGIKKETPCFPGNSHRILVGGID